MNNKRYSVISHITYSGITAKKTGFPICGRYFRVCHLPAFIVCAPNKGDALNWARASILTCDEHKPSPRKNETAEIHVFAEEF